MASGQPGWRKVVGALTTGCVLSQARPMVQEAVSEAAGQPGLCLRTLYAKFQPSLSVTCGDLQPAGC